MAALEQVGEVAAAAAIGRSRRRRQVRSRVGRQLLFQHFGLPWRGILKRPAAHAEFGLCATVVALN